MGGGGRRGASSPETGTKELLLETSFKASERSKMFEKQKQKKSVLLLKVSYEIDLTKWLIRTSENVGILR